MSKQRLVRCVNGHMFNSERYGNRCNFCGGSPAGSRELVQTPRPDIDDDRTRTTDDYEDGIEPVVGWLVCIEGEQRGKDYKIRRGKNFIGRSDEMDIAILGDLTISRKNHAALSYNPKQRNFFLIPGDGAGLVYLNNEVVFVPVEISAYDVIEIGKSKLIFLPLCGIHFDWEKDEKEES
ncbi:UNVERIFIED_CONTAM: FOG: FHA domain [Acetivibrio alkalicellulosi]